MRFRLRSKFVVLMIAILAVSCVLNVFWSVKTQQSQMEREMREQANALAKQMDAVWQFISVNQNNINYTKDGYYEFKGLHCSLVGKSIGAIFSKETEYITRFTNFNPRNPADTPDEFESAALTAFLGNKSTSEYYELTDYEGEQVFRYVKPMRIDETCLECHGEPVGELDVLGYPKEGWKIGDLGGAMSIIIPTDTYVTGVKSNVTQDVIFFVALMFFSVVIIYFAVSKLVTRPLSHLGSAVEQMRGGDFEVSISNLTPNSEIEELAGHFNELARELNDLYADLENKVASRTEQLERANSVMEEQRLRLEEANEMLIRDNEYKSDFLAIMSHELRTPLTSIIAFAELLERGKEPRTEHEDRILREINGNSHILLNMINNILEMARLEAGKLELMPETVDFGDILGSVESVVRPLADKKDLKLVTRVERGVPLINADWEKLRRIIENLISNAVKFTPRGGEIDVLVSYDEQGNKVLITVCDDGIGIKKEEQGAIFEKFMQSDTSASRRYNGTGLGLALARELAELHGGSISVESTPGEGSCFTVVIPADLPMGGNANEDNAGR